MRLSRLMVDVYINGSEEDLNDIVVTVSKVKVNLN